MAHQFFFNSYILDNLPSPTVGFDVVQDMSEPRLRMYITQRGVKSFFVRKRINGVDKRIILGKYPDMDIEEARSKVNDVLYVAAQKKPLRRKKISFESFVSLYMNNKVRRGEISLAKLQRSIDLHLTNLKKFNIQDITSKDIQIVLSMIKGKSMAYRMQELLLSIFNYAKMQNYINTNPVKALERIDVVRRERHLTVCGLKKLMTAIKKEKNLTIRATFYMLIYGFANKDKIFKMKWSDLDFNHDSWCDMPLSDRAILLLQDLPQDGEWVFMGRGRYHIVDPRITWKHTVLNAGIDDLTMDDVHKFLMRKLEWSADKEILRQNMNNLLDELLA